MSNPKSKLETFIANAPWVDGQRVEVGSEMQLTAAQAKYEPVSPKPARTTPRRAAKPSEAATE